MLALLYVVNPLMAIETEKLAVQDEPGESLSDCDKDDEDECMEEPIKDDEDNGIEDGFFVPDGYLSVDEVFNYFYCSVDFKYHLVLVYCGNCL